jgi:hypothetical protein
MAKRGGKHRSLAELIREAFVSVEYPGDDRLVYDTSGGHLECDGVAAAFKGKRWAELSVDFLRRHADSIFFFTPEAYRFYLPAYLLSIIGSYRESDVMPVTVLHSLTPPEGSTRNTPFERRARVFDAQQRGAIRAFLQFLMDKHSVDLPGYDPQAALAYWR